MKHEQFPLGLLIHMARQVPIRIVGMHKRAIYRGHTLQDILQTLAQIVAVSQTHVLVQHDVDLDVQLIARVIRLQALDVADRLRKAHGEVEQDVALVRGRGRATQVADVFGTRL